MSGRINYPDSQNDVVTTMTHVALAFQHLVGTEMPNISVVYDEQLSYETGIKKILNNDNYSGADRDPLPAFMYQRTILIPSEIGLSRRSKGRTGCIRVGDEILTYSTFHGEFDINFLYVAESVEHIEKFEVVYNSEEGITGTKEIVVQMGDELGEFKYYLDYQDLTEKIIEHENVYYKGIIGSIKVRGFYFTFRGANGLIEQIRSRIISGKPEYNEDGTLKDPAGVVGNEILSTMNC
jgi:hypothetical protein